MTHTLRILAAAVGFEPTELSLTDFQDQHLKPLGHTAMRYFVQRMTGSTNSLPLTPFAFPSGVPTFSLF